MMDIIVRHGTLEDLPGITEIHNHYILHTHITFDVQAYMPEQRVTWFHEHSDGGRYRLLVACDSRSGIIGYACTGRHRAKEAYDTTVESSVGCRPDGVGRGVGTLLYNAVVNADYNLIMGITVFSIIGITTAILIVDLTYPLLDPRVRYT